MFFDAFVESKTTKNIRCQLPLHVFLCDFRSSLVIVNITSEVFVAFCVIDCPWMCFGLVCIFMLTFLLCLEEFILSQIPKSIKCTHPNLIIRDNILNIYPLNCYSKKSKCINMLRGYKYVSNLVWMPVVLKSKPLPTSNTVFLQQINYYYPGCPYITRIIIVH